MEQVIELNDGWFHWNGNDYAVRSRLVVLFSRSNGQKTPYMIDDTEQFLEPIGSEGHTAEPMEASDYRYTHGGHVFRQAVEFANARWPRK